MGEMRLQLTVFVDGKVKGITSVPYRPTQGQLDTAFDTLDAQIEERPPLNQDSKAKASRATISLDRGMLG